LLKIKKPWSSRRLSTALTLFKKDQRRKILPLRFHHHQLLRFNFLIVVFIKILPFSMWHPYNSKKIVCQYIFNEPPVSETKCTETGWANYPRSEATWD
jgi:hypothetical protein